MQKFIYNLQIASKVTNTQLPASHLFSYYINFNMVYYAVLHSCQLYITNKMECFTVVLKVRMSAVAKYLKEY